MCKPSTISLEIEDDAFCAFTHVHAWNWTMLCVCVGSKTTKQRKFYLSHGFIPTSGRFFIFYASFFILFPLYLFSPFLLCCILSSMRRPQNGDKIYKANPWAMYGLWCLVYILCCSICAIVFKFIITPMQCCRCYQNYFGEKCQYLFNHLNKLFFKIVEIQIIKINSWLNVSGVMYRCVGYFSDRCSIILFLKYHIPKTCRLLE